MSDEKSDLILRDWLAIERTKLANERTFLAYFRTFFVFLGAGVTILQLNYDDSLKVLGVVLTAISPIVLFIGLYRTRRVRKLIDQHYNNYRFKFMTNQEV